MSRRYELSWAKKLVHSIGPNGALTNDAEMRLSAIDGSEDGEMAS